MFITTKQILEKNKVVPAFNFATPEVARAIVETCERLGQAVILQTSQSEVDFLSLEVAAAIVQYYASRAKISVSWHLDHTKVPSLIYDAAALGCSSAMFDVSGESFEGGISALQEIKSKLPSNFLLEAPLGEYDKAKEFVELAPIDLLAPEKDNRTDLGSLRQVSADVKLPLVLHGSSSWSDADIRKSIHLGVVKINWNTCLRKAWTSALRETLKDGGLVKPYDILKPSEEAVSKVVAEKVKLLQSC
ncbi:class II fructose-bisphosphate aldolase [Candidatus Parcubacteria bacterium]|nr:class II fructose-bisphosphate aldolase [Candidatus Parcubacteria bacterium]